MQTTNFYEQKIGVRSLGEKKKKKNEIKSSIVSQHSVVYTFACDLCDADYVGYTARHLYQRIAKHKYSAIGKHPLEAHGDKNLLNDRGPILCSQEVPRGI